MDLENKNSNNDLFYKKLINKLENDYQYYYDIALQCNDVIECQLYKNLSDECYSILEWVKNNNFL